MHTLKELMIVPTDHSIVKCWLMERGLVAVERILMDKIGNIGSGAVYCPEDDRYLLNRESLPQSPTLKKSFI